MRLTNRTKKYMGISTKAGAVIDYSKGFEEFEKMRNDIKKAVLAASKAISKAIEKMGYSDSWGTDAYNKQKQLWQLSKAMGNSQDVIDADMEIIDEMDRSVNAWIQLAHKINELKPFVDDALRRQ